ncbi:MAG TPA: peptidoglycan-binding protein [Candidatus Limnocylindrales bacterium]|nr:peptidoglycan-binding protein [Candidatus Limnocylindrales bacterium]
MTVPARDARPAPARLDHAAEHRAAASPSLHGGLVLGLQRTAGNAAVGRLVRGPSMERQRASGGALRPTVQRVISAEQAGRVARQLLDAMDRWGTDEEAIYGALSGRRKADLDAIVAAYGPIAMHGSLDADLADELTESELARVRGLMASAAAETAAAGDQEQQLALRTARAQDIARQLDEAMRDAGTDETQLINALTGRSPFEIVEIARAYADLTGNNLVDEIRDEMSGSDLAQAMGPLQAMFAEGSGPNPQIGLLQQALNATGTTPPLRVTAMFGPETSAALSTFQGAHPPLTANGVLTLETWLKLDQLAPLVFRHGRMAITGGAEGSARGVPVGGTIHPTVRLNNRGAAVEELQKKLLTIDAAQVPTRPTANGIFGAGTRTAVREFQGSRTPPLPINGVANAATWAALDGAAGPVDVGREEFESNERVEGSQYGGPTRFTWRLHPDRLEISVNIRFSGAPAHPMVATWRQQMMNAWNGFRLVDDDHPGTALPLVFVVGNAAPADATVLVTVTPPGGTPGRSNAGNYHTGDTDAALAPHEFGHLLGLQDEYNTGPEQYTIITGEQPFIGATDAPTDAAGAPVAPDTIAAEIRTAVTSSPANQRGTKAQAVVATKYTLRQGAFAQRVAIAYERANAGNLVREDNGPHGPVTVTDPAAHIEDDIAARIPGRNAPETDATAPFGYSNRSLMGEMQSFNTPVNPHDHPIAERHVRHFADIVARNRPGAWRITR